LKEAEMIFFYSLCGVGVVAVGLAIGELLGRKSLRPGISGKRIDASRRPRDDRPPHQVLPP
jgi:hypothetical protein